MPVKRYNKKRAPRHISYREIAVIRADRAKAAEASQEAQVQEIPEVQTVPEVPEIVKPTETKRPRGRIEGEITNGNKAS